MIDYLVSDLLTDSRKLRSAKGHARKKKIKADELCAGRGGEGSYTHSREPETPGLHMSHPVGY